MIITQKLMNEFESLTKNQKIEVIDFVAFLRQKNEKIVEDLVSDFINEDEELFSELD